MTTTEPEEVDPLLTEVKGLRTDLRDVGATITDERRGRKLTTRLGMILIAVLIIAAGSYVYRTSEDRASAAAADCRSRIERAELVRAGIVAAADEVAIYADVNSDERAVLRERVADRVIETVPPPDC